MTVYFLQWYTCFSRSTSATNHDFCTPRLFVTPTEATQLCHYDCACPSSVQVRVVELNYNLQSTAVYIVRLEHATSCAQCTWGMCSRELQFDSVFLQLVHQLHSHRYFQQQKAPSIHVDNLYLALTCTEKKSFGGNKDWPKQDSNPCILFGADWETLSLTIRPSGQQSRSLKSRQFL